MLVCAYVFLFAVVVGAAVCLLALLAGYNWPEALIRAGVAFGGTCTLAAVVATAL
jgi:hypothetical protein